MADALSANEFIRTVEKLVKPGDHRLAPLVSGQYVLITLVIGRKKMQLSIQGFDPRDKDGPAPGATIGNRSGPGVIQVEKSTSDFPPELTIRKKSGPTQVIAKYVAEHFNKVIDSAGDARIASLVAARYVGIRR